MRGLNEIIAQNEEAVRQFHVRAAETCRALGLPQKAEEHERKASEAGEEERPSLRLVVNE